MAICDCLSCLFLTMYHWCFLVQMVLAKLSLFRLEELLEVSFIFIVLNNYWSRIPMTNLAVAASQIRPISPERVVVFNARYKFIFMWGTPFLVEVRHDSMLPHLKPPIHLDESLVSHSSHTCFAAMVSELTSYVEKFLSTVGRVCLTNM
jgi:hypothetical protein